MFKLCLLLLALSLTSAKLGVNIGNASISIDNAFCLSYDFTRIVIEIADTQGRIRSEFAESYKNAIFGGFDNIDVIFTVNDSLIPTRICQDIKNNIPDNFGGVIWLQIKQGSDLWKIDISQRIYYLDILNIACQRLGLNQGIYSNVDDWAQVFGSKSRGSFILKQLPLWYSNNNNASNFNDFETVGFGGWDEPDVKQFANSEKRCGGLYGLIYYQEDFSNTLLEY